MKSIYASYKDEIEKLWDEGCGYTSIAQHLIDKYHLDVQSDYLRKQIARIIKYSIVDKEIIEQNVRLAKQKQRHQDLNRIQNKSFREFARIENALLEYNKKLIEILEEKSLKTPIKNFEDNSESTIIVHISDTHFNELVDLEGTNKYDFIIASKRLQKFAHYIKKYIEFYKVKNVLVAMTGDLMNSDRRLDEKLAQSTNRAKATIIGVHLLKYFLLDIGQNVEMSVACITGNESRVNETLGYVDIVASDSYDLTIFEMLKLLLPDYNFISGNPNELVIRVADINLLMIHGHTLGKMDSSKIAKLISKYSRKNINIDFMICGHLHECLISDYWARSSSLVGANSYSDVALNLSSKASQNIYILTQNGRHDVRIDLQESDFEGYNIDKELFAYNAKSNQKSRQNKTIFEIVI
jgi:predicted phosphodiesterase